MVDLNEEITNNFHQNVSYLQHHQRAVYEKLLAYEVYVNQKNLTQNFTLSYEEGGFDIINLQTNQYLYGKQSNKFIALMQESVNWKKNENVFETFKVLPKSQKNKAYDFAFELFEEYGEKSKDLKEIYKFIFFGAGLHIEALTNKVNAQYYLIIEDNIELFRLSLFTTKYFELAAKAKLFFAIGTDKKEFSKLANDFLDEAYYYNQYIKFFESIFHSDEKIQLFHTLVVSQSHLNFFYSSILEQYTQPLQYLTNSYNFINLTDKNLIEYCQDKSVILVAPGPSLDKNIEFLKAHQDDCIIVALSATLKTLETADIKPDIVTHFDGFERSSIHFEKLENKEFINDSLLLFSAKTPQKIVSLFEKEHVFFFESGTNYKEGFGALSAFCAGSSTYLILVALGFKEIYLVGLDLALDQKTLKTHSSAYSYTLEAKEKQDSLNFRDSIIEVAGNFEPLVKSTPNFRISINAIDDITLGLKKSNQDVFNLNDGAKFQNTIAIKSHDIDSLDTTQKSKHELYKLFQRSSSQKLTLDEQNFLKAIYTHAETKKELVKEFSNSNFDTSELFEAALIQLKNDLCLCQEKECEILSILFDNYIRFVYGFIFDSCNTQEITINLNKVQTELSVNILGILENFASHFKAGKT